MKAPASLFHNSSLRKRGIDPKSSQQAVHRVLTLLTRGLLAPRISS